MTPQMPKQRIVKFGPDYKLSIVDEQNIKGKFELAVFYKDSMVEMPGITDPDDTVTRFRTPKDVQCIMKKMFSITGKMPENS
jgi:hypothetical protein